MAMRCVLVFSALMCAAGLRMTEMKNNKVLTKTTKNDTFQTHELGLKTKTNETSQTNETGGGNGYISWYNGNDNMCHNAPTRSVEFGASVSNPGFPAKPGAELLMGGCYKVLNHFPDDGWRKSMMCYCHKYAHIQCDFFMDDRCTGGVLWNQADGPNYKGVENKIDTRVHFQCMDYLMWDRKNYDNCFAQPDVRNDFVYVKSNMQLWTPSSCVNTKIPGVKDAAKQKMTKENSEEQFHETQSTFKCKSAGGGNAPGSTTPDGFEYFNGQGMHKAR